MQTQTQGKPWHRFVCSCKSILPKTNTNINISNKLPNPNPKKQGHHNKAAISFKQKRGIPISLPLFICLFSFFFPGDSSFSMAEQAKLGRAGATTFGDMSGESTRVGIMQFTMTIVAWKHWEEREKGWDDSGHSVREIQGRERNRIKSEPSAVMRHSHHRSGGKRWLTGRRKSTRDKRVFFYANAHACLLTTRWELLNYMANSRHLGSRFS